MARVRATQPCNANSGNIKFTCPIGLYVSRGRSLSSRSYHRWSYSATIRCAPLSANGSVVLQNGGTLSPGTCLESFPLGFAVFLLVGIALPRSNTTICPRTGRAGLKETSLFTGLLLRVRMHCTNDRSAKRNTNSQSCREERG